MTKQREAVEYQTAEINLGNRIQTIRRPVVPSDADFSEASVIAAARKQTGLHFFGDDPSRPWLLTSPQHMQALDALMEVFPDAKIVFMHRDPRKVLASGCSLQWNISILGSDDSDPCKLGAYYFDKIARQIDKVEGERNSLLPANQQLDVLYADINRDWEGQMQRIYNFIGLEFTPEAKAAMLAAADDRDARHGRHKYSLSDFGLSEAAVDARFAAYVTKYSIPREASQ